MLDIADNLEHQAHRLRVVAEHFADPELPEVIKELEDQAAVIRALALEIELAKMSQEDQ